MRDGASVTTIYHDMLSAMGLPTSGALPDALAAAWWNPSDTTLRALTLAAFNAGREVERQRILVENDSQSHRRVK